MKVNISILLYLFGLVMVITGAFLLVPPIALMIVGLAFMTFGWMLDRDRETDDSA